MHQIYQFSIPTKSYFSTNVTANVAAPYTVRLV